jgi:hypothetical protein
MYLIEYIYQVAEMLKEPARAISVTAAKGDRVSTRWELAA